jgi:hypothetical protein
MLLGEAFLAGLSPHVRCLREKRRGPVKIDPCGYHADLDLESLIWTRGASFPCGRLRQRLRCPRCGGISVEINWHRTYAAAERTRRDLYQCAIIAQRN